MKKIDLIGDIHGHADELIALLKKLGYEKENGVFTHEYRTALFVGDYIDRGPKIRETLHIVRPMVENGHAIALMGNHEYNALCFHQEEREGGHLRRHSIKNILQHYETLQQFKNRQDEYDNHLEWFKTLPLFYENENFRAVHACWDPVHIKYLKGRLPDARLTDELLHESVNKDSALHKAVEVTLKGQELSLPSGLTFQDKDGFFRTEIRSKWWENPVNATYSSISVHKDDQLPEIVIEHNNGLDYYSENEKPVFFGHYWLKGTPELQKMNVCCLDYSVAKQGELVAYTFKGERTLSNSNFTIAR
ncbi:metallophosphoesterase [Zeaxanthinibacter enoshimensis]|uniref:Calcineurin-like phosphoesterase family protein n=1 Tax=Zeaxanthinibacter enoshimensis TaxID=392009 RepID=A0A4V3D483_9FLAO|nr:metallophosphoesterase [Zeaxanthinibacter enoshimensis]TDQ33371.1 calcineurin-like phosphoesterase family protein [Zeaxanthinibacter enoshimensis]